MKDATVEASSHKAGTSNTQSNDQSEITEQLLAALMSIQQTEQQILQFLTNSEMNQAKDPTPSTKPVIYDPLHGVMPAKNVYRQVTCKHGILASCLYHQILSGGDAKKEKDICINVQPRSKTSLLCKNYGKALSNLICGSTIPEGNH